MAAAPEGPNARARDENIGESAPGLPDEAVLDGELRPDEIGQDADQAVERLEREGWTRRD